MERVANHALAILLVRHQNHVMSTMVNVNAERVLEADSVTSVRQTIGEIQGWNAFLATVIHKDHSRSNVIMPLESVSVWKVNI